jgi:hypothetical protein
LRQTETRSKRKRRRRRSIRRDGITQSCKTVELNTVYSGSCQHHIHHFKIYLNLVLFQFLYDWGSTPGRGNYGIFSFRHRVQTGSRPTQPPVQWVPDSLSLEVKRTGREADHSPSSRAENKNTWSYTSTLSIRLCGTVHIYLNISAAHHNMKAYWGVVVQLHSFTSALDGVEWSDSQTDSCTPGKGLLLPIG